jgi:hypothetical protein
LIEFCAPIPTTGLGAEAAADDDAVDALVEQVRTAIRQSLDRLRARRGPAFG